MIEPPDAQLRVLWHRILGNYSSRELSFASDKLTAFSAIASLMSPLWNCEYLAGPGAISDSRTDDVEIHQSVNPNSMPRMESTILVVGVRRWRDIYYGENWSTQSPNLLAVQSSGRGLQDAA